jgi:endoglucanase
MYPLRPYLLLILTLSLTLTLSAQITPDEMVARMGKGINLGNTLEAPHEGNWSVPAQPWYFQDIADAGFSSVRIPVRWENHMDTLAPYTVDSTWMARVEELVDYALNEGLVVIINSHHDNDWLYHEFPTKMVRFEALWEQIALHFKDKPEDLVFEIVNEPLFRSEPQGSRYTPTEGVSDHQRKQSHPYRDLYRGRERYNTPAHQLPGDPSHENPG